MNRLKSQLHFLHVFKDAKPEARRALLASTDDKIIKAIVECAINTLNRNHILILDEKNKIRKYKNRLRTLVNPKISFKSKRILLVQNGGILLPPLASIINYN